MDARMLDLPLNLIFYKWLLGMESSLGPADLHLVDPALALHLGKCFRVTTRLAITGVNDLV